MGLFKPAWKSKNYRKATNSVDKIVKNGDQIELERIAHEAPLQEIREYAIRWITDASVVADFANGRNPHVRTYAVHCLGSKKSVYDNDSVLKALEHLAKNSLYPEVRELAAEYLGVPRPTCKHIWQLATAVSNDSVSHYYTCSVCGAAKI
jgi:hypothetical protein